MKKLLLGALLTLSLASPMTAHALTPSIRLNQSDPHLGGTITFTIVIAPHDDCTKGLCRGHVEVACSQSGVLVFDVSDSTTVARTTGFVLGATYGWLGTGWSSGPADCVATLSTVDHRTVTVLASTAFIAAP